MSDKATLGIPGFSFVDLHDPHKLAELHTLWDARFRESDPTAHATFAAYRACKGSGMGPEAVSEALLAAAPHVSRFVGTLFGVEAELSALARSVQDRTPLWRFKRDFAKKRVLRDSAGKSWTHGDAAAKEVATALVQAFGSGEDGRCARRHRRQCGVRVGRHRAQGRQGRRRHLHRRAAGPGRNVARGAPALRGLATCPRHRGASTTDADLGRANSPSTPSRRAGEPCGPPILRTAGARSRRPEPRLHQAGCRSPPQRRALASSS